MTPTHSYMIKTLVLPLCTLNFEADKQGQVKSFKGLVTTHNYCINFLSWGGVKEGSRGGGRRKRGEKEVNI